MSVSQEKSYFIFLYRESFAKYFESSRLLSQPAVIYTTKILASPFKQLELYAKLLKEIQRHTPVRNYCYFNIK